MPGWHTPLGWPRNWEKLAVQLMRFFHWPPDAVWGLPGSEMLWLCHEANTMVEREKAVPNGG